MELISKRFEDLTPRELHDVIQARIAVFVVEQGCAYQDLDGKDPISHHVFFRENGRIQAYLRVVDPNPDCELVCIGRVLTIRRGGGLGREIMLQGIQVAKRVAKEKLGAAGIYLGAQSYAKGFYERLGFVQTSGEYMEDGIPHIKMLLTL